MQLEDREIEKMADMITPVLLNRLKATTRLVPGGKEMSEPKRYRLSKEI